MQNRAFQEQGNKDVRRKFGRQTYNFIRQNFEGLSPVNLRNSLATSYELQAQAAQYLKDQCKQRSIRNVDIFNSASTAPAEPLKRNARKFYGSWGDPHRGRKGRDGIGLPHILYVKCFITSIICLEWQIKKSKQHTLGNMQQRIILNNRALTFLLLQKPFFAQKQGKTAKRSLLALQPFPSISFAAFQ